MTTAPKDVEKALVIRRAKVEYVELYEIKDSELDIFEKGSPADLQLNFAVFLISCALTGLVSIFTADFKKPVTEAVFIVCTILAFILGIYCIIAWLLSRRSTRTLCQQIRQRMPKSESGSIPPDKDHPAPKG